MAKPALGRGLGALLGGNPPLTQSAPPPIQPAVATLAPPPAPDNRERVLRVPLNKIRASALQPTQGIFRRSACRELADSIREQGIVQPLIVRERDGFFELIAGERRWRAAQLLNLPEVPIITREADDRAVLELALIEKFAARKSQCAGRGAGLRAIGGTISTHAGRNRAQGRQKPRGGVANATRLLKLPVSVQKFIVREGRISVGHAKGDSRPSRREKSKPRRFERVIKEGLNAGRRKSLIRQNCRRAVRA